ncbi:hypothetical protein [Anabaena sp. CS-542/02]|nr:hypothetical protein [Anabaena sp. CS-542/02]MDB9447430.1 hypothetical protein [Anabaena sp. CS-542/02]
MPKSQGLASRFLVKETSFRIDGVFLPPLAQNQSDRYKKRTITKMV